MINAENKKLIKEFNNRMLKGIGCEAFQIEYKYKEKNLYIKQVKDSGILTKMGKRKFVLVKEKAVFDEKSADYEVNDEEMYLYLTGMVQALDMVISFTQMMFTKTYKKATPMQKH